MPGLDGTGPRGQGPMTGGGRGWCATSAGGFRPIPQVPIGGAMPPMTMQPPAPMAAPFVARPFGGRMGGGRGFGRGRSGRGGGRGRGGW
ncbi:MAG: DUF5320 domain-containing protein [Armatimonadetes bacterium]|nr:DUF5320 domain-containing protein [Armatimonadota bacterium]